jgi:hypothetical protein
MARISISGVGVEYELLGEPGAPAVAITPGGRFAMDTPGVRELGEALVAGGRRVLIWNRPIAKAFIAETEGAYRPAWSIDDVADNLDAIRDTERLWMFPSASGYMDHLQRSFDMARKG